MQRELFWERSKLQSSWEPFEVLIERSRSLRDRDAPGDPCASCTCLWGAAEGGMQLNPRAAITANYPSVNCLARENVKTGQARLPDGLTLPRAAGTADPQHTQCSQLLLLCPCCHGKPHRAVTSQPGELTLPTGVMKSLHFAENCPVLPWLCRQLWDLPTRCKSFWRCCLSSGCPASAMGSEPAHTIPS